MGRNKTTQTDSSVADFIDRVTTGIKRDDSHELVRLMEAQTGSAAKMWGPSIVGFGSYHYRYDSGHEGDAPLAGFSPRSNAIVLYLSDFPERDVYLQRLGKYKTGKSCIYINKLSDIDTEVLSSMISETVKYMKRKYTVS